MSKPDIRIGISGWLYPPWRKGNFYPKELPQHEELAYASRQVNSIEINGSFYSLQRPSSYRAWHAATPKDFVFSVKGGRFITHIKRLRDVEVPLANFFASGVLLLKEKLGPFLWQLPPSLHFDAAVIDEFLSQLPVDTKAASALARQHDSRLNGKCWLRTDKNRPVRHAMEVRHDSFKSETFIELLRKHQVALVIADSAGKWPFMEDVTSDFVYVRLHGEGELYVTGYDDTSLQRWTRKVKAWTRGGLPVGSMLHAEPAKPLRRGRDVYVYFDNDVKVRAPYDAMSLAHRLKIGPPPPEPEIELPEHGGVPRLKWPGFRASSRQA